MPLGGGVFNNPWDTSIALVGVGHGGLAELLSKIWIAMYLPIPMLGYIYIYLYIFRVFGYSKNE